MAINKIQARKESLIQRELSLILSRSFNNFVLSTVSINEVRISRDSSSAKIFYTFINVKNELSEERVQLEIEKYLGKIRTLLAQKIQMRSVPTLIFQYDSSLDNANKIEEILNNIKKD